MLMTWYIYIYIFLYVCVWLVLLFFPMPSGGVFTQFHAFIQQLWWCAFVKNYKCYVHDMYHIEKSTLCLLIHHAAKANSDSMTPSVSSFRRKLIVIQKKAHQHISHMNYITSAVKWKACPPLDIITPDLNLSPLRTVLYLCRCLWQRWTPTGTTSLNWTRQEHTWNTSARNRMWSWSRTCCSVCKAAGRS